MRHALTLLMMFWVAQAPAAVLRVGIGCTYTSVRDAVIAAAPNDELRLRTQTFAENLVVNKSLTIRGGYASCSASAPSGASRSTIQANGVGVPVIRASSAGDTNELIRLNLSGGNNPANAGGGLLINSSTRVEVDQFSATGNSAGQGGGIYVSGNSATLASSGGSSLEVSNNTAEQGAGIYVSSGGRLDLLSAPLASVAINGNVSSDRGAAIYYSGATVRLRNTQIDSNDGIGAIANNNSNTSPDLLEISHSSLSNNVGGGIRLTKVSGGSSQLLVNDSTFDSNDSIPIGGFGGGISLSGSIQAELERVDMTGNLAPAGGAISIAEDVDLIIRGGSYAGNSATFNGGAISVTLGGHYELFHSDQAPLQFVSNLAQSGGAIADSSRLFNLIDGSGASSSLLFQGNSARRNGGAIKLSNADSALTLVPPILFNANHADDSGGAIAADGSDALVATVGGGSREIVFRSNTANFDGGGLSILAGASATLDWIQLGMASGGGNISQTGGGLHFQGSGTLLMRNSAVVGNAAENAGGVYLSGFVNALISAVTGDPGIPPAPGQPKNCDVSALGPDSYCAFMRSNSATANDGRGGALSVNTAVQTNLRGVAFVDNAAPGGAAIMVHEGADLRAENVLIRDNENAVLLETNARLDLYQATLARNGDRTLDLANGPSTELVFRNSILWGNFGGLVGGSNATLTGSCNITQSAALTGFMLDPEFISGRDDFRLSTTSFAVDRCDTGSNDDLDGLPRPVGARFDIGAFEQADVVLPDAVFASSFE